MAEWAKAMRACVGDLKEIRRFFLSDFSAGRKHVKLRTQDNPAF